jgi:hypothetical protein
MGCSATRDRRNCYPNPGWTTVHCNVRAVFWAFISMSLIFKILDCGTVLGHGVPCEISDAPFSDMLRMSIEFFWGLRAQLVKGHSKHWSTLSKRGGKVESGITRATSGRTKGQPQTVMMMLMIRVASLQ